MTPLTPEEDRTLDALLALDTVPPPQADLRRRILRDFDAQAAGGFWTALWRELGGLRVAGPALAASLVLGVAMSTTVVPQADPATDALAAEEAPDYLELALLDTAYEDYAP